MAGDATPRTIHRRTHASSQRPLADLVPVAACERRCRAQRRPSRRRSALSGRPPACRGETDRRRGARRLNRWRYALGMAGTGTILPLWSVIQDRAAPGLQAGGLLSTLLAFQEHTTVAFTDSVVVVSRNEACKAPKHRDVERLRGWRRFQERVASGQPKLLRARLGYRFLAWHTVVLGDPEPAQLSPSAIVSAQI
jgi:hypothetical protein